PLRLEPVASAAEEEAEVAVNSENAQQRARNREFWDRFIDQARFDHPDQSPPRHGGNNWAKVALPPPATWMAAFRSKERTGLFLTLSGEDGQVAFDCLEADSASLEKEIDPQLRFTRESESPFK